MNRNTFGRIQASQPFAAPGDWVQINTIDMHTGGEPLRVVLDGFPELPGNSVLESRKYVHSNLDHLRTALMLEPRGHADMYGCILLPPNDAGADFGILFMHNEGYSTMCGHAIIAISTLAAELKWIDLAEGDNELRVDAPCGRITSFINMAQGKITGVRFHCVPSFVIGLDFQARVPGLGEVTYDLAYGGAFYAYVDLNKHRFDFDLSPGSYRQLIRAGTDIKQAVIQQNDLIQHPFEDDLSFLYGTIFVGPSPTPGIDSRNVCVFANGEVDRSPTGSGVSGRIAIHRARNECQLNEKMTFESITGSVFTGSACADVNFANYDAVIPEVAGTAYITGKNTWLIDPNDPMKNGFLLK